MPLSIRPVPPEVSDYVKEYFRYDPDTGELFRTKTASVRVDITKPVGSVNSQGYLDVDLGRAYGKKVRNSRVHRVIWFLHYGYWPDQQIDHINGNMKDNRISNLRLATQRENQHNGFSKRGVSSTFKGVGRSKGRWRGFIMSPSKFIHLGYFDREEDAARAYDEKAKELFGEFARLNFPKDGSVSARLDSRL